MLNDEIEKHELKKKEKTTSKLGQISQTRVNFLNLQLMKS
jgi:hypothetical protein